MADTIRALFFDFGGVFTDSPFHAVHDYGQELGLADHEITEIVFGSYENDGDHPWHRLERGEISLESARQFILELGQRLDLNIDIYDLFGRMASSNAGADSKRPLVDAVRELKADGYVTGIITNNVAEFGDGWRGLIPVDELFDFVVDSSSAGVRKPDPKIFHLALDQLTDDIDPGEVLFLDDYHANVEAAQAIGLQAMLVGTDVGETVTELTIRLGRA